MKRILLCYEVPLQILLNNSRNDTYGHASFFIQLRNSKADIILFAGCAVVEAGVGYRIDAVGKADVDHTLIHVSDLAGVFALDTAFLQIVMAGVLGDALDISFDADVFRIIPVHG